MKWTEWIHSRWVNLLQFIRLTPSSLRQFPLVAFTPYCFHFVYTSFQYSIRQIPFVHTSFNPFIIHCLSFQWIKWMWFHEPFHSFVRLPQFSSFFSGTSLRVSSFGNFITFRLPSFQSTCPTRIAFSYHSIQLQSIRVATSFIAHILTMNVVCNLTVIIPWNQSIKLIKLNLIELIWFHFTHCMVYSRSNGRSFI